MREVDRLRAEAKAKRARATAKVSRLRRVHGVEVGGTEFDPRVPAANIDKMNSRQLRAQIAKTNRFLDRKNSFVAGYAGAPIPTATWKAYEREEAAYNVVATANKAKFAHLIIPGMNITVEQRDREILRNPRMNTDAVNRPLEPVSRSPKGIPSAARVESFIKDLRKRRKSKWLKDQIKSSRAQAAEMLKEIGDHGMTEFVMGLSNDEFEFAWMQGNLASSLKQRYTAAKESNVLRDNKGFINVVEDAVESVMGAGGWRERIMEARQNKTGLDSFKDPKK